MNNEYKILYNSNVVIIDYITYCPLELVYSLLLLLLYHFGFGIVYDDNGIQPCQLRPIMSNKT